MKKPFKVFLIKYSENKRDDTFDSEVHSVYFDGKTADEELKKLQEKEDGYTYYIDDHNVAQTKNLTYKLDAHEMTLDGEPIGIGDLLILLTKYSIKNNDCLDGVIQYMVLINDKCWNGTYLKAHPQYTQNESESCLPL